jgi:hypothetical protein
MPLYPELPRRRAATLAGDALALALLVLFALVGLAVHEAVAELSAAGRGLQDAGRAVEGSLARAAGTVQGAPIVGGQLADALRDAGRGTGGEAVRLGVESERAALDLARLLGWTVFGIPTVLLLARVLPARVAQVRALSAAARVLRGTEDPERVRLLAQRAAFGLPYEALVRHTRDPLGDLAAGRLESLVAAALEDAGVRPR